MRWLVAAANSAAADVPALRAKQICCAGSAPSPKRPVRTIMSWFWSIGALFESL